MPDAETTYILLGAFSLKILIGESRVKLLCKLDQVRYDQTKRVMASILVYYGLLLLFHICHFTPPQPHSAPCGIHKNMHMNMQEYARKMHQL